MPAPPQAPSWLLLNLCLPACLPCLPCLPTLNEPLYPALLTAARTIEVVGSNG